MRRLAAFTIMAAVLLAVSITGCAGSSRQTEKAAVTVEQIPDRQAERPAVTQGRNPETGHFETVVERTLVLDYLISLPDGYSETGESVPLLLFLHGAGERGSDIERVKVHGPPKLIERGDDLPAIVVSPQCPTGSWWTDHLEALRLLLDELIWKYNVDEDRVYVTGLSMGGYGTWALAARNPGRFAAAIPICGGGTFLEALRLRDLPVWVFHGLQDQAVPWEESQRMVDLIRGRGGEKIKLTIYEEADHDSWTKTYDDPAVWEWLFSQRLAITARGAVERERLPSGRETALFNGRDLSGWDYFLVDENVRMEDVWSVEDGILVCTGDPRGYLCTEDEYQDYRLVVEWRWPEEPGNSGVLMRITGEPEMLPNCVEAQLRSGSAGDMYGFNGFKIGGDEERLSEISIGWSLPALERNEKEPGEWNRYEITVFDGTITVRLNGMLVNEATDCDVRPGKIGLQSEGGVIHFRSVTLVPLGGR